MFIDILLNEDDNFVVAGIHSFIDMSSATMDHWSIFTPSMLIKFGKISQDGYPLRIKGVHFAGASGLFDLVYRLFAYAFSEKVKKRVSI